MLLLFCKTTSAIGLTEFTKQLINLYDSTYDISGTKANEFFLLSFHTEASHYKVSICALESSCPWEGKYVGPIAYKGYRVYLLGQQDSLISHGPYKYSIRKLTEPIKEIVICDPIEWEIIIDKKDLKLNKQPTNSNIIIDIQDGQLITDMDSAILVQLEKIVSTYCGK